MTEDYTPTTEEVRGTYVAYSFRDCFEKPGPTQPKGEWVAEFDRWLSAYTAEVRASVLAEQGEPEWEYVPGWIGVLDGRARVSAGVIAPSYVAQYIAEGGEVVRRMVGRFEAVTADLLPVEENPEALTDGSER